MLPNSISNPTEECERLHAQGYRQQLLGEWEQARHYYEQALECKPDYAVAHLALAQLIMMQSCFHEGRELYQTRFMVREETDWRQLPTPSWCGEPLKGKHLHLWVEQGFGDVIMYAAFLPLLLAQEPSRITLSMFPKMMTFFARSFPHVTVGSLDEIMQYSLSPAILDTFPQLLKMVQQTGLQIDLEPMRQDYERAKAQGKPDYAAPMGDLMVYGLPGFVPAQHQLFYMSADPHHIAATHEKLARLGPGRRVGISWHTVNNKSGGVRNVPLEQWLPILQTPGCHFISLQHSVSALEIEHFNAENGCTIIADPEFDPVHETEGLVALTACMDEVITIDNSNAHLAGALGIATTLLLPKGCDFRWPVLEGDDDTLWYKNMKLERQSQATDWQPVIARVAAGLRRRVAGQ